MNNGIKRLYMLYIRGVAYAFLFELFRLSLRIPFVSKFTLRVYLHFKDLGYETVVSGPEFKGDCRGDHVFIQYETRFEKIVQELDKRGICVSTFPRRYIDKLFDKYLGEYRKENPLGMSEYTLDTYARYMLERAQFLEECIYFCKLLKKHFSVTSIILPKFNDDYTFELLEAFHRTGWTTFVYDREGTVTRRRLNTVAPLVAKYAGFCNYLLTYNKEHTKFFERVFVNHSNRMPEIIQMGNPATDDWFHSGKLVRKGQEVNFNKDKKILFFAFGVLSYVFDTENIKKNAQPWQSLLRDIHNVLEEHLVTSPSDELLYKRGPKGGRDYWDGSEKLLSSQNAHLIPPDTNSNNLIIESDIVVAFQTTALIDAMHTGKVIIYCGWGDNYNLLKNDLIDFEMFARKGALLHADSPEKLKHLLSKDSQDIIINHAARKEIRESFTSNPDGKVSMRAAEFIEKHIGTKQ